MDRERERREGNHAGAGAAGARRAWDASPDGVIVLPAGSAMRRQSRQQQEEHPQREREQPPPGRTAGAGILGEYPEPPEKALYKTKLCEKFEAEGWCAYEGGCSFAHGAAELRPPASHVVAAAARNPRGPVGGGFYGKVCFEFRDTGACHWGERCTYAHVTAAEAAEMRFQTVPRVVERSLTPPRRTFSPGGAPGASSRGAGGYGPPTARAFPAAPAAPAQQGDRKVTRLEFLSQKKMAGIYGDWPEED